MEKLIKFTGIDGSIVMVNKNEVESVKPDGKGSVINMKSGSEKIIVIEDVRVVKAKLDGILEI